MSIDLTCDVCGKTVFGSTGVESSTASRGWYEPKPFLHLCSDTCLWRWSIRTFSAPALREIRQAVDDEIARRDSAPVEAKA